MRCSFFSCCPVIFGVLLPVVALAETPTIDATEKPSVSAAYADFTPAAEEGSDGLLKVGASTSRITFGVPALRALTLDTTAGAPETLTLMGNLGATAGVTLSGSTPKSVIFAPEAGQLLDFGTVDASRKGIFNGADALIFDGAGAAHYHLGTLDEAAGRNLTAQIIAQGIGDYTVTDNGDDACMDFDSFSAERPIITVKGGSALTLQARNFTGWDAAQGSGAFLPNIVTLLEGGTEAAQTATLHRIPMPKTGGVWEDNLTSPIVFQGHAVMTIAPEAMVNLYRSSDTEAMLRVAEGATARIAAPEGAESPAKMTIRNGATPIIEIGDGATLSLDVILARNGGGETLTLRGGGTTILTQPNTATETLKVTQGSTLTFSGTTAAWAGPIVFEAGTALTIAQGATVPFGPLSAEGSIAVNIQAGGTLAVGSERLAELSNHTLTMEEGASLRITLASADYLKGSLTLPEPLRGFAEHCTLLDPSGTQMEVSIQDDAFTFTPQEGLTFALPSGWEEMFEPPTFAKTIAVDTATANQGLAEEAAFLQTLNGQEAIVAEATGAVNNAVLFGGYPYGNDGKTLSQDVWLKISGGTFRYVIGGNDMQNYSGNPRHLSGNTLINISGGAVDYAYSCNLFDGKPSTVTGRHALVIDGDAVLKGSAAATAAIHGSGVTYADATLNLTVRNLQNDNSATQGLGVSPGWTGSNNVTAGFLVGGGMTTRYGGHTINGDTSVCVELGEEIASGTFSKTLIGGNYTTQGNHTFSISGSASVAVSASPNVLFDRDIVGGSLATGNATMTTGSSSVTLAGGTYTGTITAGSQGAKARNTGDATLTLDGANVSAATLQPGNVDGASRLVLKTAAAPKALTPFDVIDSEGENAVLTLPETAANLSETTGTFTLDASAVETLSIASNAKLTFVALPKSGLDVNVPADAASSPFSCTVPEGTTLDGLTFTMRGFVVQGTVEGTTLTLSPPKIPGPFTATVSGNVTWRDLVWLNDAGERAISFADALAAGATLRVTTSASLTLAEDIDGKEQLLIETDEGSTLTIAGSGKLNPPLHLSGALTLAEGASAASVTLSSESSSLTLDLGHGSGKHANMIGALSGPGELRIYATGGNWDAGSSAGSWLFASRLNLNGFTGTVRLGDGTGKIRCAPQTFANDVPNLIILGKGTTFRQLDTWGNNSYPCYLTLQVSSGAHLQDGSWGNEGCGIVRTGYSVNFRRPISGVSTAGEPPALINAYAGTGGVNFDAVVTGDGIATGSWGSGESRAMNYNLNNENNAFALLLIRNMKLSTTSQVATTVNAKTGGLGGSAITFGTENGQPNISTLNVNGDNTVASITATNGGNITLAAGVRLTVTGATDLSGLAKVTIRVPDGPLSAPLTPLTAQSLTLDPAKVHILSSDDTERNDLVAEVTGGTLRIRNPIPFADGVDSGLSADAKAKAERAAADAGVTEITAVQVATGGNILSDAEIFNGASACFNATPTCNDEGVVTLSYEFGIAAVRPLGDGRLEVTIEVRGGTFTDAARLALTDAAGTPLAGIDLVSAPGETTVKLIVDAERLTAQPFKAKAIIAD